MFTAVIKNKVVESNGLLALTVDFKKGDQVISTEVCKPQDEDGFNYWLKARLTSLETGDKLKTEDNLNKVISVETIGVKTDDNPAKTAWFEKLNRLNRIRTFGIESGLLTGEEKEVKDLVQDLRDTFDSAYINSF